MHIHSVRHSWPESPGFHLCRPQGSGDYVLLHFQTNGEIRFDNRFHQVSPGAFIIFAPHTPHELMSSAPLLHDWMHLSGPVDQHLARFALQCDTIYMPACTRHITETIAALEAEFFAQRNYGDELMQARLTELFILVARSLQGDAPSPLPRETADRLRSLRAEMLLHPERPWTSQDMARHINLSVPRLYPLYRQMFSVSPNRDLILIRIEKGRNMLRQGESVSSVAEQLGYANVTHFIRQYTQIVGVSPSRSR